MSDGSPGKQAIGNDRPVATTSAGNEPMAVMTAAAVPMTAGEQVPLIEAQTAQQVVSLAVPRAGIVSNATSPPAQGNVPREEATSEPTGPSALPPGEPGRPPSAAATSALAAVVIAATPSLSTTERIAALRKNLKGFFNLLTDEEIARIPPDKLAQLIEHINSSRTHLRRAGVLDRILNFLEYKYHYAVLPLAVFFIAMGALSPESALYWNIGAFGLFFGGVNAAVDARRRRRQLVDAQKLEEQADAAEARLEEARKREASELVADIAVQVFNLVSSKRSQKLTDESQKIQWRISVFLLLSMGGPVTSLFVVLFGLDPHYLFASLALSGVPFAVAATLLRHDGKLRTHQRDLERELARLERVRLAVDFAKTSKDPAFPEEMKKLAAKQILQMDTLPGPEPVESQAGEEPLALLKMLLEKKPTE